MNNQNIILKILLFPFNLLKHEVLGIYYTIYALLYPFIFIFNKIGDKIFNNYEKKQKNKEGIETLEEETINSIVKKEKRVFASLLRADGPYTLSGMIGIPYDEYKELMCKIGERLVEVEENKN